MDFSNEMYSNGDDHFVDQEYTNDRKKQLSCRFFPLGWSTDSMTVLPQIYKHTSCNTNELENLRELEIDK